MRNVFLGIFLSIAATFIGIYFLFESLQIGEYVWPILLPTFGWTFGIMIVVFGIVALTMRAGCNPPPSSYPSQSTYYSGQDLDQGYDGIDSFPAYSRGSVRAVPVYCPYCGRSLELDEVRWVSADSLVCPSCNSTVRAEIREE
jgi:hypothetical protein